jgi:hypothetical protein
MCDVVVVCLVGKVTSSFGFFPSAIAQQPSKGNWHQNHKRDMDDWSREFRKRLLFVNDRGHDITFYAYCR